MIVDKIDLFLKSEDWYERRGIPYKLVFLLHGLPGTGKSSLIYGLASHFNHSLGTISSVAGIGSLIREMPERTFVAIEDIDMLSVARPESADAASKAASRKDNEIDDDLTSLQILINTLDGLTTPHGLVVFITTNHKERLDHALIRPGRIDCDLEIGPLCYDAARRMFAAFYGDANARCFDDMRESAFVRQTGAELQAIFLEESEPTRAIQRIRSRSVAVKNCA